MGVFVFPLLYFQALTRNNKEELFSNEHFYNHCAKSITYDCNTMAKLYETNEKCLMIIAYMTLLVFGCYGQYTKTICCDNMVNGKPFNWPIANRSIWHIIKMPSSMLTIINNNNKNSSPSERSNVNSIPFQPACQMATATDPNLNYKISLLRCENTTINLVNTYLNMSNQQIFSDHDINDININNNNSTNDDKNSENVERNTTSKSSIIFNALQLSEVSIDKNYRRPIAMKYVKLIKINEKSTEYLSWIKSNLTTDDIELLVGLEDQLFLNMTILQLEDNQINSISKRILSNLPNLLSLNLSNNQIESVLLSKQLFQNSPKLTQLDLSRNKLMSILVQNDTTIRGATASASAKTSLNDSNNYNDKNTIGTYFECNIFGILPNLEHLDLSNNMITDLPRNAFEGLQSLKCLNLAFNQLFVTPFQAFHALTNIEHMDLSFNKLVSVFDNFFIGNKALRVLQLQYNAIEKLSKYSLFGLKNLQHLDISYNQLLSLDRNAFDSLTALETLNLNGNKLKLIPTTLFSALHGLHRLDLSENDFRSLPNGVFASQHKLEKLIINNCAIAKLGNFVSRQNSTVDKNVLVQLRYVSISNNDDLHKIESITFQNMPAIEELILSGNRLQTLPIEIGELKMLKKLDISRNDLIFIPRQINELKYLKTLNLLGNNYACDCNMHWLSDWMDNLTQTIGTETDIAPINQLNQLKCRHGYPGDMMRVLQHLHCAKPYLIHVSDSKTHLLRNEAQLECSFYGNPAPDVIWVTPTNQIIRHHADPDAKPLFINNANGLDNNNDNGPNSQGLKMRETINYHKLHEHSNKITFDESVMGFSLLENGSLRIHNVSRKDSGLYTCYGYNIMGYSTANIR